MSGDNTNHGIQVFGGALNSRATAVGERPTANYHANVASELSKGASELRAAIDRHPNAVERNPAISELSDKMTEEVHKEKLDKGSLQNLLSELATEAKSTVEIATAVGTLSHLVGSLF